MYRMRKFRIDYQNLRPSDQNKNNQNKKHLFYTSYDPYIQIKEIRAAIIIQRWYRGLEYQHRSCFFRELNFYLST